MSRFHSYLKTADQILNQYKGEEPFASYLKKYFSQHKKYGSKDRKQISHLCYCYFRLGKMAGGLTTEERIIAALFLCSDFPNDILQFIKPEWNEKIDLSLPEKLKLINPFYKLTDIFPWQKELSDGIEHEKFCKSFLVQPDLFLRIRPGYEKTIKEKLTMADIPYKMINDLAVEISNASKIDTIIELDKEAMVQDLNSQRIAELMKVPIAHCSLPFIVWDCCAASGGKSIMLYDLKPDIRLTVSDIRESILLNLGKRFAKAGIKNYKSFIADLSIANKKEVKQQYDLIIADVPCSGSGTWGRTPEQLLFFNEQKIKIYSLRQQKICNTAIDFLKPGGWFLYITCSVFKEENEEVVEFLIQEKKLELKEMKLFKGYDQKADTLFAALLHKPL